MRTYPVGSVGLRELTSPQKCNFVTAVTTFVTAVLSDTVGDCVIWLQSYTKNYFLIDACVEK